MAMSDNANDGREIADLLPFYATGAIGRGDKARLDVALPRDAALRHEFGVVEEERQATIELNESLGVPSRQARERLFAMLAAEPARKAAWFDPAGWLASRLEGLRPRTLAWAGVAAVLVVAAQAGVIGLMMAPRAGFETASVSPRVAGPGEGALLIVAFAPDAKAGDIARLLDGVKGTIVAGPRAGAFFQVRVGGHALSDADRQKLIATLVSRPDIVRFAAPGDEEE